MFDIKNILKIFQIFDVFWGRRSKIYHGIKDGGAKATAIADPSKATELNGNTIFNVNHPDNECFGGHYHNATVDPTEVCFEIKFSDWVNNRIEIIASGVPVIGQIGPHGFTTTCLQVQIFKTLSGALGDFKEVELCIIINSTTRSVFLCKSGLAPNFSGKVVLDAKA